jgi:HEAT repeat protein
VDLDAEVRQKATDALGRIDPVWAKTQLAPTAVGRLIKGLEQKLEVRHQASHLLSQIGRAAVGELVLALADNDKDTRQVEIARTLGRIGPQAAEAVLALADRLGSDYGHVRQAAAEALGQIGQAAVGAVPGLIRLLGDSYPGPRVAAVRSLGQLGPAAHAAASPLVQVLSDSVEEVRKAALGSLARIGEAAVRPLTQALTQPNVELRLGVAEALWRVGAPEAAVPALTELFLSPQEKIYLSAASLLLRMGQAAKPAVRVLVLEAARADAFLLKSAQELYDRNPVDLQLGDPADHFFQSWNHFLASLKAHQMGFSSDHRRLHYAVAGIVVVHLGVVALREAAQDADDKVRQAAAQVLTWLGR